MFEEFDDYEDECEDGKVYIDSIYEFQMLSKILPMEEVGISFNGEIKIDEKTSVITDKQIKLENPEVAVNTYQKVMEMRELTEVERANVNKFKLVLKKIFDVYFRGQKFRRNLCVFWTIILGFDIATENYFGALIMAAFITLYTSPIKFIKEVRKIFSKKKREELSEELSKVNMLGYVNSVDDDEGIKLYFRPGSTNM